MNITDQTALPTSLYGSDTRMTHHVIAMLEHMPTLRDQFAAAALSGMLANPALVDGKVRPSGPLLLKQLVADAVVYADAMLEARKGRAG